MSNLNWKSIVANLNLFRPISHVLKNSLYAWESWSANCWSFSFLIWCLISTFIVLLCINIFYGYICKMPKAASTSFNWHLYNVQIQQLDKKAVFNWDILRWMRLEIFKSTTHWITLSWLGIPFLTWTLHLSGCQGVLTGSCYLKGRSEVTGNHAKVWPQLHSRYKQPMRQGLTDWIAVIRLPACRSLFFEWMVYLASFGQPLRMH